MGCASSTSAEPEQQTQQTQPQQPQPQQHNDSPASKLYRHALESIFAFCSLPDLHAILAVTHDWSAVVESMSSLRLSYRSTLDSISHIPDSSRLARHVHVVSGSLSAADLQVLSARLPQAEQLLFSWNSSLGACEAEAVALSGATRIRAFEIAMNPQLWTATSRAQRRAVANYFVKGAGSMQQLEAFALQIQSHDQRILLAPLNALTRLRSLSLVASGNPLAALPSDEQVAAIRQMHLLERFHHNFTDRNGTLRLLLATPIPPLRWQSALVTSDADLVPLLHSLPALTDLDVECVSGDVEFLLSLPRVRTLSFHPGDDLSNDDVTRIVATLLRCSHVTALHSDRLGFTSAQLAAWRIALSSPSPAVLSLDEEAADLLLAADRG